MKNLFFPAILTLSASVLLAAPNQPSLTEKIPEKEIKTIRNEAHECVPSHKMEGEQTCKSLVTGKVLQIQTLKLSSKNGTWEPQTQTK